MAALEEKKTALALSYFEQAAKLRKTPIVCSSLAYCLAKERQELQKGIFLCMEAMLQEPNNPVHYFNMGRIYLLAGEEDRAIKAFRHGLKSGRNPRIIEELRKMGIRRPSVIRALGRDNPLNKYLGLLFARLGMR